MPYARRKADIQETITPLAAVSITNDAEIITCTGRILLVLKYARASTVVPAGSTLPMAYAISRVKASVSCETATMEASTRKAGKSVRREEYAAALAVAKASC